MRGIGLQLTNVQTASHLPTAANELPVSGIKPDHHRQWNR